MFKVCTRVMIYEYYLTTWEVVLSGRDITSYVSMAACQCLDAFPLTLVKMSGSVSLTIHRQQDTFKTSLCDLVTFMVIGLRYPQFSKSSQRSVRLDNTSGYVRTSLEGKVQLNNGIQEWTFPYTGMYFIEAFGASGANEACTRADCSPLLIAGGEGARGGKLGRRSRASLACPQTSFGVRLSRIHFSPKEEEK